MSNLTYAQQVVLEDDFEDGDFTQNPEWVGDLDDWTIINENGNNLLRLDAEVGGVSHLSTVSPSAFGVWEFFVRLDGFATSDTNRAFVFLTSDRADTETGVNGYAVRIGESGANKFFRIVRFDNGVSGASRVLVTGTTLIEASVGYQVRVTRSPEGEWRLFVSEGFGSEPVEEGTPAIDLTYTTSEYFGIRATYTVTRARNFFFDNIRISKFPLTAGNLTVIDNQNLQLSFSEAVDETSVAPNAFSVNQGIGTPSQVSLLSETSVGLFFSTPLVAGTYELSVSGIRDQAGGVMEPQTIPFEITEDDPGDTPVAGDVVINEIFYDTPIAFAQYVEIFNRTSNKRFNLREWSFTANASNPVVLTQEDVFLEPGEFLVLTSDSTGLFTRFGARGYLESASFPTLPRTSAGRLQLISSGGVLLDEVPYIPVLWGGEGVAIERRSAFAISYARENWLDSTNGLGGTPGQPNTAQPDPNPVSMVEVTLRNPTTLNVVFDRHIDRGTAEDGANFNLSGGLNITFTEKVAFNTIRLFLSNSIEFDTPYTITASDIESIFGVPMAAQTLEFSFEEPDEVIVIFEDFEDGDFTQNPAWFGDRDDWAINPVNGNNRLFLNASAAGVSHLSTASIANYGTWEFLVNTKYATSDNNRSHVFLMSDTSDLKGNVNGYAVRIGESGSNKIFRIVRFDDGNPAQVLVSGTTIMEANVDYRIRVTRERNGEWRLFVGTGSESEPQQEGQAVIDNTHANASWFGMRATYTATRLDLVSFDDIRVTKFPLFLASVVIIDSQNLDVVFSEAVDPSSVSNASFNINEGIGSPNAFTINSNTVRISYSNPIPGGSYALSISGIRDLAGGVMEPEVFAFNMINVPVKGDVVINEFFYSTPSDLAQYIELKNATEDKLFNLRDWRIQDNTTTIRRITTSDFFLAPGEYVVLSSDTTSVANRFGSQNFIQPSNFPSLNRSTPDQIKLFTSNDVLIDSLRYVQGEWGGSSAALERRSLTAPSHFSENWSASTNSLGGTPGQSNTATPDPNPVQITSVSAVDASTVSVLFNRTVDKSTAENLSSYEIQGIQIQTASQVERNVVNLSLTSPLQTNTTYTFTTEGVQSIFGVPMPFTSVNFTFLEFQEAEFNDIVVNEFLYRPVTAEIPRFIELHNRSNKNIDLHAWQIGRSTTVIQLNSPSESIPIRPGEYLVISDNPGLLGVPDERSFQVPSMLALSSTGDAIFLRTPSGTLVDSLRYSPDWGGPVGISLERKSPEAASNDRTNWISHPENNSAGETNAGFMIDTTPPDVIFATRTSSSEIEVRFNEFISPTNETIFSLGGSNLSITDFNPFTGNRILLQFNGTTLQQVSEEVIRITNLQDVSGNVANDLNIPIAQPLQRGDIVINEIMYQPISGRFNDFPDQSEYVEFHNTRDYAISMEGFHIHDQPDRDGNVSRIFPVSTTSAWIPANGFVVMFADPNRDFANTRISRFFGIESERFFFRADRSTLSLSTQGDSVFLAAGDGTVIDSVIYQPTWHNPNLVDVRGIALERINPNGPSNDASNWGSSVVLKGGTPGERNSLFAQPGELPTTENLIIEPNPFSPDGDGMDDNLFLNYKLSEPDYLLRVRIFDRYGRLVRTLADGIPAGLEGSLIWDGRRDNGMENRIGIYVIHFEAFNSATGRNKTFQRTVVLARKL